MADKKKTTRELYGKKPLTEKELGKKAGMDERTFRQHRQEADLRPEHAKWKNKKWSNL